MSNRPSNPGSPLGGLIGQGQSLWLDYMHRRMLQTGELKAFIQDKAIRGATSNPTIFEQAIGQSDTYDEEIAKLAARGLNAEQIYETLAVDDIREACDQFRPIFDMADGEDGFVSIEVSPKLAHDTRGTVEEARRLWQRVNRPNVMIKIPGTLEGLPAVTAVLADGINVNITLLFAVEMYERVIDAFITGVEQRLAGGHKVETLKSVASFFVSRVDTETDKRLEAKGADPSLIGTAAVANAKLAYAKYVEHFEGRRFRDVMAKGAAVQRPLWASTGTKNPKFPDTKYVDNLIGPDTINTLPIATLEAFADHGRAARTIDQNLPEAKAQLAAIEAAGVSLKDVTDFLVKDGVKKFADSFDTLLKAVETKRAKLAMVP